MFTGQHKDKNYVYLPEHLVQSSLFYHESNLAILSSMDYTLDIMADGNFDLGKSDKIEFFYTHGTMACPIEGCQGSHFSSKTKYQRHWDEPLLF